MKIQILGTAAAEGWPGIFCGCDTCQRARASGGKNIRSRSGLMINENIKVDLNSDIFHHVATHGLDLSLLEHIVFTHSHNDHFDPPEFQYLAPVFSHDRKHPIVSVWASEDVIDLILKDYPEPVARPGLDVHAVKPFTTVELGEVKATPIPAVHRDEELCLNWIFGGLDNAVLYASDTGPYDEETWEFLSSVKFDLVISECTYGFMADNDKHMSVPAVRKMRDRMLEQGCLKDGYRFVITHFSHNMGLLHHEMEEHVKHDGFIVAYDGIVLEGGA